ncbi:hypothetical protein, conserved in T. vivax [Trypanosoma vivax Y486]|uniref:Uncharacterized protein n=1 Tax=Trypanosoma vivax (strain Y486) TaxID=1055687 RepID=F9WVK4_TRYVY|nr:hypothetical protein, conserved in T. vivax [Trypanosoma vivax Y486]|eukprot:CCD21612.1 hypothetical protein, conserved in T. vivax [Trypanosoma vivax Y486]
MLDAMMEELTSIKTSHDGTQKACISDDQTDTAVTQTSATVTWQKALAEDGTALAALSGCMEDKTPPKGGKPKAVVPATLDEAARAVVGSSRGTLMAGTGTQTKAHGCRLLTAAASNNAGLFDTRSADADNSWGSKGVGMRFGGLWQVKVHTSGHVAVATLNDEANTDADPLTKAPLKALRAEYTKLVNTLPQRSCRTGLGAQAAEAVLAQLVTKNITDEETQQSLTATDWADQLANATKCEQPQQSTKHTTPKNTPAAHGRSSKKQERQTEPQPQTDTRNCKKHGKKRRRSPGNRR